MHPFAKSPRTLITGVYSKRRPELTFYEVVFVGEHGGLGGFAAAVWTNENDAWCVRCRGTTWLTDERQHCTVINHSQATL